MASRCGSGHHSAGSYPSDYNAGGGDAEGDHLHEIEGVIGSAFADALGGNEQRNVFCGEGGADSLYGADGNDRLEGGGGKDVMLGGNGRDSFAAYDGTHDHLNGGPGTDSGRGDRLVDLFKSVEIHP